MTRRHSIQENLVCFPRFALQKRRRRKCRVGFNFLTFIIGLNNYLDPIFQDHFYLGHFYLDHFYRTVFTGTVFTRTVITYTLIRHCIR